MTEIAYCRNCRGLTPAWELDLFLGFCQSCQRCPAAREALAEANAKALAPLPWWRKALAWIGGRR